MKTAEEKAEKWLKDNGMIYSDSTIKSLSIMIKRQDRETRHAASIDFIDGTEEHGDIREWAIRTVMNVKAV